MGWADTRRRLDPEIPTLAFEYARRGKTSAWRYLTTSLLALPLAILIGALAVAALRISDFGPPDLMNEMLDMHNPEAFILGAGVLFGSMGLGLAAAARWVQAKSLSDLLGDWRWKLVAAGAFIWALVATFAVVVDCLIAPGSLKLTASAATLKLALFSVVGLTPQVLAEELIFRGFVTQAALLATKRALPAAILSGLLFGACHIPNGAPQAVSATAFGILASLLAIRLCGVAFTFGVHLANNLFGAVVVASASDVFAGAPAIFTQHAPHLMWWDAAVSNAALLLIAVLWPRPGSAGIRASS